jgi:hypothetical protein
MAVALFGRRLFSICSVAVGKVKTAESAAGRIIDPHDTADLPTSPCSFWQTFHCALRIVTELCSGQSFDS